MATMRQPRTSAAAHEAPPSTVRFDWIMVLVTIWGIGGLFLDGWAHSNVPQLETFFTPWHAVLYSGYLAVAATLVIKTISNLKKASSGERASGATLSLVRRIPNRAPGVTFLEAVPAGYGLSLLGVGIFALSGVADLTWHLLFGIERSVEALLSPTHLGLALGGGLVATGPLRAAWRRRDGADAGSWRHLGPVILTLNTGLMAVFNPEVVVWLLPCAGLAADLLYKGLQPAEHRPESIRLFALAVPAILYLFYFLNLAIVEPLRFQSRITWSVHFWAGSIVLAGIVGFLLSYGMFPPLTPMEKQEEPHP